MPQIDWIYRRTELDLMVMRAASLQGCANQLEALLLERTLKADGERGDYLPPQTVLGISPETYEAALRVLHFKAYRENGYSEGDYRHLLARVGRPRLPSSPRVPTPEDVGYWPQVDRPATRRDLLHFYLLVRAVYEAMKAELTNRPVSPEALSGLAQASERLLGRRIETPATIGVFVESLIGSWESMESNV